MKPLSLLKFVPKLSPRFVAPVHLLPLIKRLERAHEEPLRIVSSVPPRHSKTETLLHLIVWLLLIDPYLEIMFISYAQRIAEKKSALARAYAMRAGVQLSPDSKSKSDWRTLQGGGLWASSPGGSNTGNGGQIIIVDDPIRGRADAESALERDKLYESFTSDIYTRAEPSASIIVNHTRWHVDDLGGRLIARGWEHINLPALDAEGEALWPERWPAEEIEKIRATIGDYNFSSLYLGEPRPRGGELFKETRFYSSLPEGCEFAIGCDLAYSKKTHADYSAAVVLAKKGDLFYVVEVVRGQVGAPAFARTLKSLSEKYGNARIHWFTSTTEIGLADLMREQSGIPIRGEIATVDKFQRAQRVAAAWNAGKVLLPREATWLETFVSELLDFTGVSDRHDDQVDALSSAHKAIFREIRHAEAPPLELTRSLVQRFNGGLESRPFASGEAAMGYGGSSLSAFLASGIPAVESPIRPMSSHAPQMQYAPEPNSVPAPSASTVQNLPDLAEQLANDFFKP